MPTSTTGAPAPGADRRAPQARERLNLLLDAEALGDLWRRWHERTAASAEAFVDMVHGEGLELALDLLYPFAHWVTPELSLINLR